MPIALLIFALFRALAPIPLVLSLPSRLASRPWLLMGNIERLFSRYFAITTPLPAAKTEIAAAYAAILPIDRPSDWPQALMDFANAVCTPKQPLCDGCCFAESCQALARGLVDQLPVKPVKTPKPGSAGDCLCGGQ
jgi:adenine-specific DNA glycosylase